MKGVKLNLFSAFSLISLLSMLFLSGCGGSGSEDNPIVGSVEIPNEGTPAESTNLDTTVPKYNFAAITGGNAELLALDASRILAFLFANNLERIYTGGGAIYRDNSLSQLSTTATFCQQSGQLNYTFNTPGKLVNSEGRVATKGETVDRDYLGCTYIFDDFEVRIDGAINTDVFDGYHDGIGPISIATEYREEFDEFLAVDDESNVLEYRDGAMAKYVYENGTNVVSGNLTWVFDFFDYAISYSTTGFDFAIVDNEDEFANPFYTFYLNAPAVINSEIAGMQYRIEVLDEIVWSVTGEGLVSGSFYITSGLGRIFVAFNPTYLDYFVDADNDGFYEESGFSLRANYF